MLKRIIFILTILISVSSHVYANEGILLDDCVDLSNALNHSEGIYASVVDEESKSAYDEDLTMIMRRELKREWLEYTVGKGQYLIFNTYFRQNEEIFHFEFEESEDGENWTKLTPNIKISSVDNSKWIPVTYKLSGIKDTSKYIKIYFNDKNAVEWSPMMASVYTAYKSVNSDGFADCIGMSCENEVAKLKNLGFINGYNQYEYKPLNNVTRAEIAKTVSCILNTGESNERVFADVEPKHWVFSYLAPLYRQGIINGDEEGNYNPESDVTYAETAKMLVASLGYSFSAKEAGGYPYGYIKVAERLNIFDGISVQDLNLSLNRGDMALMISNALEAEILIQSSFGENPYFEKGETILYEYHNITTIDGVLNSVAGMSVSAEISTDVRSALIGDKRCKLSEYDASDLLGMSVTAYIDENYNILYVENNAEKVIDIPADKYIELRDNALLYENADGKECKASVDNNTRIVLNGIYYSRIGVIDELKLSCGNMRIICNDSAVASTILINEYTTYLSQNNGNLSGVISDKISSNVIKFDFDKAELVKVISNGEVVDFNTATISANDVISVSISDDGKIININISSLHNKGKIEYYNKSNDEISINFVEYKLTDNVKLFGGEIKPGNEVSYYTDINGRIFAIENSEEEIYAYLMGVEADNFNRANRLQVLKSNGMIEILTADDRTKLCGASKRSDDISNLTPQLIKIKYRNDNSLISIDIAGENDFELIYSSENCKYFGGYMSVFASKYQLSENTPIFYIPSENDKNKYKVINKYSLFSDFNYNVQIYDLSDEYIAGAVVVYEDGSRARIVDSYDNIALIKNIEQIANAEGNLCLKLSVYINGEDREIYFDNDGGIDMTDTWLKDYTLRDTSDGQNPFKCGEVIQYYSDSESHCRSFRMMLTKDMINQGSYYEKNTGDYGALNSENYFSELYTTYANVNERFSDKLLVSIDGVNLRTIPISNAKIYIYNKARNLIEAGTVADISKGGEVFVRMSYGETLDILIIE